MNNHDENHTLHCLIDSGKIDETNRKIASQIEERFAGRPLVIIGVLQGAFIFVSDLVRLINIPLEIEFIRASSYGNETESSGVVEIRKDIEKSIASRDVILVEDIVDTGLTIDYLSKHIQDKNPNSLSICSFLNKPSRRKIDLEIDFCGVEIEDRFVVGYGLDYAGKYRNLPGIYELELG